MFQAKDEEIARLRSQLQKAQRSLGQNEDVPKAGSPMENDLEGFKTDHVLLMSIVKAFEAEESLMIKSRRSKVDFDNEDAD